MKAQGETAKVVRFDSQKISTDTGIGTGADGNEAAEEKKTRREEIVMNQIKMKFVIFVMLAAARCVPNVHVLQRGTVK